MNETLAMIVWCTRNAPSDPPLPYLAIGVEVARPDHDGDPPLFVSPGPDAPEIMFRRTSTEEFPAGTPGPAKPGFKLYGIGRWPASGVEGEDIGNGRAEPFAVSPQVAADVLNRLMRMGWMLSTCPDELKGIHERAWNPKEADDIRPLSAATVEAVCNRVKAKTTGGAQ